MLVGVAAFLGSEVVLSPVVSGCLPSCWGWGVVGVAASRTKTFRNQNHRFQSKFAYCKLFGVYAAVIWHQVFPQTSSFSRTQEARQEPAWPDILPIYLKKKAGFPGIFVETVSELHSPCSYVFVFELKQPESYGNWLLATHSNP